MIGSYFRKDLEEKVKLLESDIESLKKENEKLRSRLSKREIKSEIEPSKYQDAQNELRRAYVTIESLEQSIARIESAEKSDIVRISNKTEYLTRVSSLELLDKLDTIRTEKESLISVYLMPHEKILSTARESIGEEVSSYMENLNSETGIVGFFDTESPRFCSIFAIPPYPPRKTEMIRGTSFDTSAAREIFNARRHAAFIAGHAGESFIGVVTESELLSGQFITSSVMDKHSKGGWSQKRFEKLRDEDIRHHIEKSKEEFSKLMEEYEGIIDTLIIAGDKKISLDISGEYQRTLPSIVFRQVETKPDRHAGERYYKELFSARWYRI